LRWGMLTNGRQWRLYFRGALSVAEDFLEIDLGKALALNGCELDLLDRAPEGFDGEIAWRAHVLKLFLLLFGRATFLPDHRGETFHQAAADILARERKLSDLVTAAYGLTPKEVALMWRTAPPRMPLDPAEELRRLALPS
jgi:hypothetical protein